MAKRLRGHVGWVSVSLVLVGLLTTAVALSLSLVSQEVHSSGVVSFVDPMPILPHLLVPIGQSEITVHLQQFNQQLNSGFPNPTPMWGYNGTSPGPVIEVESGQALRVNWENDLPTTHVLAAPAAAMSTGPLPGDKIVLNDTGPLPTSTPSLASMLNPFAADTLPDVRNVTHLHGAVIDMPNPMDSAHNSDGWPDAWNVPGQTQIADYPNPQDARTLFFHDHAVGETGRNVAAGLVGVYEIHDDFERSLNLPSGNYDIPIVFMAIGWNPDGSRYYTYRVDNEFYGNGVLVNGKLVPYLAVEPRKYRFRLINADNARSFEFTIVNAANNSQAGPAMNEIGTDAGFLPQTVVMSDLTNPNSVNLYMAPAERADVIVDFSQFAGQTLLLMNNGAITDPDGELALKDIMEFKVAAQVTAPDTSSLPTTIRTIEKLDPTKANKVRQIVLSQIDHADGSTLFQLNGRSWEYARTDASGAPYWDYQISQQSVANTIEEWDLVNTSVLMHPFHVHLVEFQILDRTPFDVTQFNSTGQVVFTGPPQPPGPDEIGWKDVVRTSPHMVTRIIMRFGPQTGYYIYHCHILEHEDMDMMLPFQVLPAGSAAN